jgi:hypothetical protein
MKKFYLWNKNKLGGPGILQIAVINFITMIIKMYLIIIKDFKVNSLLQIMKNYSIMLSIGPVPVRSGPGQKTGLFGTGPN